MQCGYLKTVLQYGYMKTMLHYENHENYVVVWLYENFPFSLEVRPFHLV
jgi:hypothetical protein